MGRAFPELHHETFNVYGVSGTPAVISDGKGNTTLFETTDNHSLETFARAVTIEMGGDSFLCDYPMSGQQVQEMAIPNTIDLGVRIGSAIRNPRSASSPLAAVKDMTENSIYGRAIELFSGKITAIERRTEGGFAVGQVTFDGLDSYDGDELMVDFQNGNLIARLNGEVIATVPDLITVLERETGQPVTTEGLRYGYRVTIIGIPTPEIMRSNAALEVWGPEYFGYDTEYIELERRYPEYYQSYSVPPEKEYLIE